MRLPVIEGLIRRRLLVNFAADPSAVSRLLPSPLRPKLAEGRAIVGICLIRLEEVRPRHLPAMLGVSSENAAHRIAVTWTEGGVEREGVYIPRRDTDSTLNHLAGGRLFPGEHHRARFAVQDDGEAIDLRMRAEDGAVAVDVSGARTETFESRVFPSLDAASSFFRAGSLGYSPRKEGGCLDGITLHTESWTCAALRMRSVRSTFFESPERFPPGTLVFDCALVMRDIPHEWHSEPDLRVGGDA